VSLEEGVLIEPLVVAVHVVKTTNVCVGGSVVIFGAGTIGFLCAAVARAFGATKVVSVDIVPPRLDFAQSYASTHSFLPYPDASTEENAGKLLAACALPDGADVVLECSGAERSTQTGIAVVKRGGQYGQAGLGKKKISFPILEMSEKEGHVHGSFRYGAGGYEAAIWLLEDGKVKLEGLVSSVVPVERGPEAWEATRKGVGRKNVIEGPRD
jgi:D-xylulose reductase